MLQQLRFFVTTIVIIYSVRYTYKIFVDVKPIKKEIEIYFKEQITSNKTKEDVRIDYLNNFVEYWKDLLPNQSNSDFDTHCRIITEIESTFLSSLKSNDNTLLFDRFQENSKMIISYLLQDERLSERGLLLINRIYNETWKTYLENKNTFTNIIHFNILSDLFYEINEALFNLSISKLENIFRFDEMSVSLFSDNVLRVNYCISDVESRKNELSACFSFLFAISKKISTSEYVDKELWTKMFNNLWCSSANIKDEYRKEFEENVVNTYFYYAKGFILFNRLDIVKSGLYVDGFNNMYTLQKSHLRFLPFLIHCYIYYFAEYETTDCISEEVKKSCMDFLFNEEIIGNYKVSVK